MKIPDHTRHPEPVSVAFGRSSPEYNDTIPVENCVRCGILDSKIDGLDCDVATLEKLLADAYEMTQDQADEIRALRREIRGQL